MINEQEYAKNKITLTALRNLANSIRVLELINDQEHESLNLAIDSLHFYNEERDLMRYNKEIDRFNKLYNKIVPSK